jgi:UDP-N-acetylglucosamine 2-epimerase (non-hydrolysing)
LAELAADLPVVFPVHPRTRKMLDSHADLRHLTSGLRLLDPLGYLDFLALEMRAGVVVTDSGGVQEETSFLGIPCLTVRPNTERPITIVEGTNRLVDPAHTTLQVEANRSLREATQRAVPRIEYWDGRTAPRAISALCSMLDG